MSVETTSDLYLEAVLKDLKNAKENILKLLAEEERCECFDQAYINDVYTAQIKLREVYNSLKY